MPVGIIVVSGYSMGVTVGVMDAGFDYTASHIGIGLGFVHPTHTICSVVNIDIEIMIQKNAALGVALIEYGLEIFKSHHIKFSFWI